MFVMYMHCMFNCILQIPWWSVINKRSHQQIYRCCLYLRPNNQFTHDPVTHVSNSHTKGWFLSFGIRDRQRPLRFFFKKKRGDNNYQNFMSNKSLGRRMLFTSQRDQNTPIFSLALALYSFMSSVLWSVAPYAFARVLCLFVLIIYAPVSKFSIISKWVFLCWTNSIESEGKVSC